MSWDYEYEKTVKFLVRNKYPGRFTCPLSPKNITKNICHGVETCLECHNQYYPGSREFHPSWRSTQFVHFFLKLIPIPNINQDIDTIIAKREIFIYDQRNAHSIPKAFQSFFGNSGRNQKILKIDIRRNI